MAELLLYSGSSTYYTEPTTSLVDFTNDLGDTNKFVLANPNKNGKDMIGCVFSADTGTPCVVTIESIDVTGLGYQYLSELEPGVIVIRIYELNGAVDNTTTLTIEDLDEGNLRSKYVSETINQAVPTTDSFFTLCVVAQGYTAFSFDPETRLDNIKHYAATIQISLDITDDIKIFKLNSGFNGNFKGGNNDVIIDSFTLPSTNITEGNYFILNTINGDTIQSANVTGGNAMGWFMLGMWGSLTLRNPVCFHGNSLVHTDNGVVYAKHITEEHKLTDGTNFYSINTIIKSTNCTNLVHIPKHSIDKDQPYSDFYVTRTHMIKVGDEEYQAQELVDKYEGLKIIELTNPCNVYTFITEKGDYVKINGLNVKTFNTGEFINY